MFKIEGFSLILIGAFKKQYSNFYDDQLFSRSFELNLRGMFVGLVSHQQYYQTIVRGSNITILNTYWTPLHSLRWMSTTLFLSFHVYFFIISLSFLSITSTAPRTHKFIHSKWLIYCRSFIFDATEKNIFLILFCNLIWFYVCRIQIIDNIYRHSK